MLYNIVTRSFLDLEFLYFGEMLSIIGELLDSLGKRKFSLSFHTKTGILRTVCLKYLLKMTSLLENPVQRDHIVLLTEQTYNSLLYSARRKEIGQFRQMPVVGIK